MLNVALKARFFEAKVAQDGFICFYGKEPLTLDAFDWDHLNNDPDDNRFDNLVLCCHKHNCEKKTNFDFRILAIEKLKANVSSNFLRVWESEKKAATHTEPDMDKDLRKEIDLNVAHYEITQKYLDERLQKIGQNPPAHKALDYTDTLNSVTYICKERTGHGAQPTVRRHLDALTSSVAPYEKKKIDGTWIIRKREGN